jgi:hydroxymethylpyrimidine/phosphomethylpyrimidine kinase
MTPPPEVPAVLTIAGSDSSGGAGIQADVRTIASLGAWPLSVVTAVTAQGRAGVFAASPVDEELVRAQLHACLEAGPAAAKTGMLATAGIVRAVAATLRERGAPPLVCDPVLRASASAAGGAVLLDDDGVAALLGELLSLVSVITPNAPEAERLTGLPVRTVDDAERAGRDLLARGAAAVLVKGGHLEGAPGTDVLVTADGTRTFAGDWIDAPPVHGTGCVFSAALATALAFGATLPEAAVRARAVVRAVIRDAAAPDAAKEPR